MLGFGNNFGQDFERDVCFAFSFVCILELTSEQFWLLHLRILYVGLCWHQVTVGRGANKSPFLAPIYDQVPSMLYKPQKHICV